MMPKILGRWYTNKSRLLKQPADSEEICSCRMLTGESIVNCSNQSCQIFQFHSSCPKVSQLPKTWYCPNCQMCPEFKERRPRNVQPDNILKRALEKETICICKVKAKHCEKLIECHTVSCNHEKYFHLSCLNYKWMPNNAKNIWQYSFCKVK